jgi:formate-dependent nitrite reductase membrane component NrfD
MPNIFAAPPGWSWDIILYFFLGGLAGGAYFIACLLRLLGVREDLPLSRIGFYIAFPLINICGILLIKDLGVPRRFLHMVFQSERLPALNFKWWSPISFGTWILTIFAGLAALSFLHALLEARIWRQPKLRRLTSPFHDGRGWLGRFFLAGGALWGLLLGGYTGLLLMVTNAPTWSHDPFLASMFMASGVATGSAAIFLLALALDVPTADGRHRVLRTGVLALTAEAVLLLAAVLHATGWWVATYFLGWWAAFFWLLVLPFGIIAPLVLLVGSEFRNRHLVRRAPAVGAGLILVGGLMFRMLEIFGGQAYYEPYQTVEATAGQPERPEAATEAEASAPAPDLHLAGDRP